MIRSLLLVVSLFVCMMHHASASTATIDTPSTSTLAWQGAWHFEPGWFSQQHPWLPKFLVRKALASTLILDHSHYHQVDQEGKPLKDKRPLRIKDLTPTKAKLIRTEKGKEIEFHLEKRQDDFVYYCEGEAAYRLLRPSTFEDVDTEEL